MSVGAAGEGWRWYEKNASEAADLYSTVQAREALHWLLPHLPRRPTVALDVGAGSGRDARWLAGLGWDVVAVEPSTAMRLRASASKHLAGRDVTWINDSLPDLEAVRELGTLFGLVLVNAVWMHLEPSTRARAFKTLVALTAPGGLLALSVRCPTDAERGQWGVDEKEIHSLSRSCGATLLAEGRVRDFLGRPEVTWRWSVCRRELLGPGKLPGWSANLPMT